MKLLYKKKEDKKTQRQNSLIYNYPCSNVVVLVKFFSVSSVNYTDVATRDLIIWLILVVYVQQKQ